MTTTPIEGNDPRIRIDERTAIYLAAYFANRTNLTAYDDAPPICPECGCHAQESPYPHIVDEHDNILVGCEGYFLVDPAKIDLPGGNWSDFRDDL